ncbi:MAG: hypothetical protein ACKVGW_05690 [Verrucomicrobiia bacterium]|jgi:tetrahydromethanopterin S-methyltransferase subunit F
MKKAYETFDPAVLESDSKVVLQEEGFDLCILLVEDIEYKRALKLIEQYGEKVQKQLNAIRCPNCGSMNTTTESIENENSLIGSFLQCICSDCELTTALE